MLIIIFCIIFFYHDYTWCSTGSSTINDIISDKVQKQITCRDGTKLVILQSFTRQMVVFGCDIVCNTRHYAYETSVDGVRKWFKVLQYYIPYDQFENKIVIPTNSTNHGLMNYLTTILVNSQTIY